MRQESPRDILIWDDASHIPADIKATALQSHVRRVFVSGPIHDKCWI